MSYGMYGYGSIPDRRTIVFSITSRPALGPIQPLIQRVPEPFPPGIKRQGHEADHSPESSAEVKNGGAIPPVSHASSWRGD
jgi:hypothetical protein